MEIKPFNKLPFIKFFQHDLEKIKMAFRLSDTIRIDVKNMRAAGDEVELSIKDFFKNKLYPRYHVCDGHIVDSNLKISPQYDLIISENSKNPVLFSLADKSELIYFEPVFSYAEIKRSFYSNDLLNKFSENVKRFNNELKRADLPPNFIETGNNGLLTEKPLTSLPLRNPILKFMFFINSSNLKFSILKKYLENEEASNLPNYIVLLDSGVIVNLNKSAYQAGKVIVNIYPQYEKEENFWAFIDMQEENNVLIYQYLLLLEHLNNTIVGTPEVLKYTNELFDFSISNIQKI
ncbi:MAG: hypothetical protein CL868_02930 [Cytophagaceae bacterium]|nr:hypothetical protein [Cytophagaceae bacterium]